MTADGMCLSCANVTFHTVRVSLTDTEHVMGGMQQSVVGTVAYEYEIVQCDGCHTLSFREFWSTSNEDPDYIEVGPDRQRLFPPRLEGRTRLMFPLPDEIEAIYTETYWALSNGFDILAGIGIRAIVERVCHRKGATAGKLAKKIDKLVDLGVLSKNDAKAIHGLRDLGNDSAHEAKAASPLSLAVAMNVVEHLLRQVFYVDSEDVRKHIPQKQWPTPEEIAAGVVAKAAAGEVRG